ncbi:MAG TPA: ATP-binding protein, partial [Pseudomonadota bacterium]|nr:ATP-binding protein [Pseudomonadota bacterium]
DAPVTLRKSISGTLPEQLEQVNAQLDAQLVSRPVGEPGIRAIYREEYPTKALRELARNLVQHRIYEGTHAPSRIEWYDDRVEFVNPGGPFGRASEGEFGSHSDYRNPTITQLLAESGYVEQLGRGVRMVRAQLAKNGNPPLEVEQNGFTQVIVRRRP